MYTREYIVERVKDLFFARKDVYAQSFIKSDGTFGYTPSRGPLTEEVIYNHLAATDVFPTSYTIGTYSTSQNQEVCWLVWDIDCHSHIRSASITDPRQSVPALQTVRALSATLKDQHIPHYIEDSGHGWHIWCFTPPLPVEVAYKAGRRIITMTEDCATDIECYPKQPAIGEGLGNLVKLPLGRHWSGKKCWFVDLENLERIPDQWLYLMSMQKVDPLQLYRLSTERTQQLNPNPAPTFGCGAEGLLPGPPCVGAMWRTQLGEGGGRNQILHQLAVNLQRAGFLDREQAKEILALWNNKQIEPLDEREFDSAIEHAYNGARYSYGSDRPIIENYCNVSRCPVCDNPYSKLWSVINATRGFKI